MKQSEGEITAMYGAKCPRATNVQIHIQYIYLFLTAETDSRQHNRLDSKFTATVL